MIHVPIHLPEPLLGYRCNLRGCCCRGWAVPLRRADLERLLELLPGTTEEQLTVRGQVRGVPPEPGETSALLLRQGPAGCQLLDRDRHCTVHARFGVAALPEVCAQFPSRSFLVADRLELRLTTLCPAVLEALFAGAGPVSEVCLLDPAELALPASPHQARIVPEVLLGERSLTPVQAVRVRQGLLAAFNERSLSASRLLGGVLAGLAALARGDGLDVDWTAELDEAALAVQLFDAAESWRPEFLAAELHAYRPFLAATEPLAHVPDGDLLDALAAWPEHLVARLEPVEQELRDPLLRFLWVRGYSILHTEAGTPTFDGAGLLRTYALTLRLAAAFAALAHGPVSRELLCTAAGLASYVEYQLKDEELS